ncbi:GNAT family N-acetyltransferase [Roseospirillum parvum]|nr:GNAT family N-acetyltransferase [Roseospirillum parvum]
MFGLVAEDSGGELVGLAHGVTHPGTWSLAPVCYLEDLYVDPEARLGGVGRALIDAVAARARALGCAGLYWQTDRDNAVAQVLYNKLARRTGWVRYEMDLEGSG